MKSACQVARRVNHIDTARWPRFCFPRLAFIFIGAVGRLRAYGQSPASRASACVYLSPYKRFDCQSQTLLLCSYHRVWPPRRYHSAMFSRSKYPFNFLPLLAAVILIPSFMIRVTAAPTCGLISHQVRAGLGSPNTPSAGNGSLEDVVATGWYAGWLGNQLPPTQISWNKYTALTFAFA